MSHTLIMALNQNLNFEMLRTLPKKHYVVFLQLNYRSNYVLNYVKEAVITWLLLINSQKYSRQPMLSIIQNLKMVTYVTVTYVTTLQILGYVRYHQNLPWYLSTASLTSKVISSQSNCEDKSVNCAITARQWFSIHHVKTLSQPVLLLHLPVSHTHTVFVT